MNPHAGHRCAHVRRAQCAHASLRISLATASTAASFGYAIATVPESLRAIGTAPVGDQTVLLCVIGEPDPYGPSELM